MRSYTQILILSLNTLPVFKNKKKTFSKIKLLKAGGSDSKRSACSAGDPDSIPGSGRSPREGNGNPLHYSCLENSMDRLWGRKELDMTEGLTLSLSWNTALLWQRGLHNPMKL